MDFSNEYIPDYDDDKYKDFFLNWSIHLSNQPKEKRDRFFNFLEQMIEDVYQKMINNEFNKEDPYYPLLLKNLLGLYEDREEYDRCVELKKLIDNIKTK